jgi:Ca2+-binding EF-hand superfamily protein
MLTDLQLKKLPKMFALNDNNGDGVIAQEDFEEAARVLARFRGLAPGTPEYEEVHRTIMSRWDHIRVTCDADGDNRVTLKEWLAYWDRVLATEGEYERVGKPFSVVVARTLDLDGDGQIAPDEYTEWLSRWGVDEKVALECFARLDLNGDGHLSVDEFVTLVAQYFQSSDPSSPGNWLLGPFEAQLSSAQSAKR